MSVSANRESFFSPVLQTSRHLIKHFSLMLELFKRELAERHAGQLFGMAWLVVHPIVFIGVYLFLFGIVFKAKMPPQAAEIDYIAFLLSGLVPWLYTQQVANNAVSSLIDNKDLLKQVVFPSEILPSKSLLAAGPGFALSMIILIFYIAFKGMSPGLGIVLLIPVLLVHCVMLIGAGLVLSIVSVYVRDLKEIVQLFTFLGTFGAPIFYMVDWLPAFAKLVIYLNPFSHMVIVYRDVLLYGAVVNHWSWLVFVLFSLFVYIFGARFFQWARHYIGDRL